MQKKEMSLQGFRIHSIFENTVSSDFDPHSSIVKSVFDCPHIRCNLFYFENIVVVFLRAPHQNICCFNLKERLDNDDFFLGYPKT